MDSLLSIDVPLHILVASVARNEPNTYVPAHEHPFFQLEIITRGVHVVEFGGKAHPIGPRMATFFRPFESHSEPGDGACADNILVKFEAPISWLHCLNLATETSFFHAREVRAIVTRWARATPMDRAKAQMDLGRLFLEIATDLRYEKSASDTGRVFGRTQWLVDTLEFVSRHVGEDLTVADLARSAHLSSDHFTRLFRARMGVTPLLYIQRTKTEKAKTMLADRRSCKEVASELGYWSPAHFSRAFKQITGIPPSQWPRGLQGPA